MKKVRVLLLIMTAFALVLGLAACTSEPVTPDIKDETTTS